MAAVEEKNSACLAAIAATEDDNDVRLQGTAGQAA
jgi:hypothetical protein